MNGRGIHGRKKNGLFEQLPYCRGRQFACNVSLSVATKQAAHILNRVKNRKRDGNTRPFFRVFRGHFHLLSLFAPTGARARPAIQSPI